MIIRWVALATALMLMGCSSSVAGKGDSAGGSRSLESPQVVRSAAVDPCAGGPTGCVSLGEVDVDGDGALDKVGIATQESPATVTLRVSTVDGVREHVLQLPMLPVTNDPLPVAAFAGAFMISRDKGADLVVHTQFGQGNGDDFHVIGWQNGELVEVPHPPEAGSQGFDEPLVWSYPSEGGTVVWIACDGNGKVTMNKHTDPTSEGVPLPGGGILQTDHWQFDGEKWTAQGSENVPAGPTDYSTETGKPRFRCDDQRSRG